MRDKTAHVIPMAARKYLHIPISEITVMNSRSREKKQFEDNVRSIGTVGLLKPIVVNQRQREKLGKYELVCGEGRFLAYKSLGEETIPAEVINCDQKTALLYSLAENIARVPPNSVWFAREMKRMTDSGLPLARVAQIVGKPEKEIADYIRLVELGEDRLIRGVESGWFSISFALAVAKSSNENIQQVLMDAFDSGLIDATNTVRVRTMIEYRLNHGKQPRSGRHVGKANYTLHDLKRDITIATEKKEGFVRESQAKENRLLNLIDGLGVLWKDPAFIALITEHELAERPTLSATVGS